MIHHVTRATRHLIFWSLLTAAIGLTVIRLMLVGVDKYKAHLETRISAALDTPVKVGKLRAAMRGVTPELILRDLEITPASNPDNKNIHVDEIRWGLHLGQYLLHRELLLSSAVTLIGTELSIYRASDGHIAIEGLKARAGQPLWLLQGQYNLLDSRIIWQDRLQATKPIVLDHANLAVLNDGNQHQIKAMTRLPANYGGSIKVVADIEGEVDHPEALTGNVFIEGQQLNLPELVSSYLPLGIRAINGVTDFKLWSRLQPNAELSASGVVNLQKTVFIREGYGQFSANKLDSEFMVNLKDNTWRIDVDKFELQTGDTVNRKARHWPGTQFTLAYTKPHDLATEQLKLALATIDIAEAAHIGAFFLPITSVQAKAIDSADIKGKLNHFVCYAEPKKNVFALSGQFDGISVEASTDRPGFDHVSGRIKTTEQAGVVEIAGKDTQVNYGKLFAKPVLFNEIKSLISWRQSGDNLVFASDATQVNSSAFNALSRFDISFPKAVSGKPFVDLQVNLTSRDISKVAAYFPTEVMKPGLKSWLTNAFKTGRLTAGDLLFYGNVDDFPFTNGAGVFQAELDLDKVELKFHPDWLPINAIKGQLILDRDTIVGKFDSGQMGKASIKQTNMLISGLGGDVNLNIKGEAEGEINQVLKVLQQSPIADRITPVVNNTKIFGTTKGTLDLTVPLAPGKPVLVDANAELNSAQLTVNRINLPIKAISGAMRFTTEGVFADNLQASALGFPLTAKVNTVNRSTLITAQGRAPVEEIAKLLQSPLLLKANGESAFQVGLTIPPMDDNSPIQTAIKSDLTGIEFDFPGGIRKTKLQAKSLDVSFVLPDKQDVLPVNLNYNNELKAAVKMALPEQNIISGHVLLGKGFVNLPKTPGIKLEINKTPLPLQDYLALAGASDLQQQASGINEIRLRSETALWDKKRLGNFDLVLKRNPNFWSGEINSTFAKGIFDIPLDFSKPKPAVLAMDMLDLSALRQFNSSVKASPGEIKLIPNIRSKKTLWRSVDLGQLILETEKTPFGLRVKQLSLEGEDQSLTATGDWQQANGNSVTTLQGQIAMRRADELFSKLNITKDFTQTSGNINFQLNWHASPWQLTLADLRGHMDVNLKSGRILSIEPGFGRILGIVAVEQWIKRLELDFSDVFAEGLTYNSIKGDFNLSHGKASTQNLFIDAVPARITITGDTDYINQTLDHLVKVVPKSLDAVPIAGTIMGKVADLIGETITGKNQEGFFMGKQYKVKGDWSDAEIKPLHNNDGILQKTWTNITGGQ